MKSNTALKVNSIICLIIIIGVAITSIISYRSNIGIFQKDIEMLSALSSDGLYNEISDIVTQPISDAIAMANDPFLTDVLLDEQEHIGDKVWEKRVQDYLEAYRAKYYYASIFWISAKTNNYYGAKGLDRVLYPDNPENDWYYSFLRSGEEYSIEVDNDEAKDNSITIFVNCRIKDEKKETLGIVGVGLRVDYLQELLVNYESAYGIKAYLVNAEGRIEVSTKSTGYENKNIFDLENLAGQKGEILKSTETQEKFWYSSNREEGYVVTKYEPNLKWYLVVENDTSLVNKQINSQLMRNLFVMAIMVLAVLLVITWVVRKYNAQILKLTVSQELEYQHLLHEMTEGLYEDIFELDITNNCAGSESTRKYFESLGISGNTPYDTALQIIAKNQIKEEYVQGYLDMFSTEAVLNAFQSGITNLSYDFMITTNGVSYHWVRLSARIFFWNSDKSVRLITFRLNIDEEKKREILLLDGSQRDSMTGLYNKRTTEQLISQEVESTEEKEQRQHALIIFDIDNFKSVNDSLGHIYGDFVINEIAGEVKTFFFESDILGRIGGDEFAVLMKNVEGIESVNEKLTRLCQKINDKEFGVGDDIKISCSMGVSLYPKDGKTYTELFEKADQALYYAKSHGKNSFVVFGAHMENYSFRFNQRDLEMLMNASTDGLAQFACTEPLTLLYFNQKCMELFGIPASVLTTPDFDPMKQVHPDEQEEVYTAVKVAINTRKPFSRSFRVLTQSGEYLKVELNGVFISELYKNKYPIFYVMYSKLEEK